MTYVLLESLRPDGENQLSLRMSHPEKILQTRKPGEVTEVLEEVEKMVSHGYTAIGFLSYEAGFVFLPNMPQQPELDFPLVWFAVSKDVDVLPAGILPPEMETSQPAEVSHLALSQNLETYLQSIDRIKRYIEAGHTYQVNYTMKYSGQFRGSTRSLYKQLRAKQRVNYAGYIETEDWAILSLSPELFFRKEGRNVMMKPMKGTAARGRTPEVDEIHARSLRESEKEQSENLMIVDMLRNDLGKVCKVGSIRVDHAMEVERYETLFQMTSSIAGILAEGTTITELFRATFPSGSVTGAPKVRTMQIIHDLEQSPRKIYTGSIGFISPEASVFNVAIRTACVDFGKASIEMGVGSGILYEADPVREYQECELKGKFLTEAPLQFRLFETILWSPQEGYCRLEQHMDRLLKSADYFLFPVSREQALANLKQNEVELTKLNQPRRVRLFLDNAGTFEIETSSLEPLGDSAVKACFSLQKTNSHDRFLYHKTTNRPLYDEELKSARNQGCFDVVFRNERDEITEGAITNLFIKKDGIFYTPPLSCGALAGTYRSFLMQTKPFPIEERVLFAKDLKEAEAIYLTNALRGLIRVFLDM